MAYEVGNNICKDTYKKHVAHLTLEIVKPRVLEVEKHLKVSFTDMLGIVGMSA
jgi:hypothetical protein